MTPKEIILEARTWLGTPFHHQASVKSIGSDCAGLVKGIAKAFGEDVSKVPINYSREPSQNQLEQVISSVMDEVSNPKPGNVILFKLRKEPQHLAVLTDINTIIHAYQPFNKVAEHRYDDKWQRRAYKFYRYRLMDK